MHPENPIPTQRSALSHHLRSCPRFSILPLLHLEDVVRLGDSAVEDRPVVRLAQRTEHFGLAGRVDGGIGPFMTTAMIELRDSSTDLPELFEAFAPDPADGPWPSVLLLGGGRETSLAKDML
jgi:hypothetical protein